MKFTGSDVWWIFQLARTLAGLRREVRRFNRGERPFPSDRDELRALNDRLRLQWYRRIFREALERNLRLHQLKWGFSYLVANVVTHDGCFTEVCPFRGIVFRSREGHWCSLRSGLAICPCLDGEVVVFHESPVREAWQIALRARLPLWFWKQEGQQ